jgi:mannose-1-phosphate guanylyltransferase
MPKRVVIHMRAFILAGGKGQRLWPLSTPKRPKQFIKILSDKTLLEQTYTRLRDAVGVEDIFVIVPKDLAHLVKETLRDLEEENIIEKLIFRQYR